MPEIELSTSFFLSILQNSTDLISIIDAAGNYKFVGGSVKAILGYTPEEMIGTSAFGYIHELDQERTGLALQHAITNKFTSIPVFRFRTRTGAWRWIDCSVTNLADNPEVMGFVTNSRDVTDRVEEEERKKESQAHYEALFYNHPDAVFQLNQQGQFSKINKMVSKILEYADNQILGHHFQKFVHPDFMPAATEAFVHTMAGKTQYVEISVIRKSGTTGILGITVLPVIINNQVVSLLGIAKDITQQRQQQERLEKLSLIAQKTATCMMVMNRQWEIEWVNEAFEKVLGYSLAQCAGKHPAQLLFGPFFRDHEKIRKKVSKTGIYRGEVLNYTSSGTEIWFNLEVSPVTDHQGQVIQYIAIRTDITDRKKKEAELIVVTQDLFKQNRDLQQFSYMVSHNLRAPAANLIGLSNLVGMLDKNSSDFDQTLQMVNTSATQLDEVIREMNQVLSLREIYDAPNLEEVDLKEIFGKVLDLLQPRLNNLAVAFTTELEENLVFKSDKVYLLEILKNLLSNAIKFRKKNEVLQIKLQARRRDHQIELCLQDNGIGMDMAVVSKELFKPYKKFHPGHKGRGIGLFLVKTYLDVLGGEIKIASLPGKGTTLKVTFLIH